MLNFQNVLVFIFLYIPPLIFFIGSSLKRGINKIFLIFITLGYLYFSISTQNLLPFILVIFNILYLRKAAEGDIEYRTIAEDSDYIRYNFNLKNFRFWNGLTHAIYAYGATILVGILVTALLTAYKLNLKEQEIVRDLMKVSLDKFLYMVPIMLIFAPIVEEFTFRWIVFEKLLKPRLGIYLSALISSLMFSVVHFNLRSLPVLMTIGLINCYLIDKKGYWYAVFSHLFFNSVNTLLMFLQKIS